MDKWLAGLGPALPGLLMALGTFGAGILTFLAMTRKTSEDKEAAWQSALLKQNELLLTRLELVEGRLKECEAGRARLSARIEALERRAGPNRRS